jgi:TldD protein
MYNFPKNLYCDVRIEKRYETAIQITQNNLDEMKEKEYKAAFIRLYDGKRWYYTSTTELKGIQREIDALAQLAHPNPSIENDPVVKKLQGNREKRVQYTGDKSVQSIPLKEKKDLLDLYIPEIADKPHVAMWRAVYIDGRTEKQFYNSKNADIHFDYQRLGFRILFELTEDKHKFGDHFDQSVNVFEELKDLREDLQKLYRVAVSFLQKAKPIEEGYYPVVLSPEAAGVFAHESFGHKSEADFMLGDETMRREWALGKKVASDAVTIIDDGEVQGVGYVPYDDEGSKSEKTYLIKKGILSGRLHSSVTAAELEEEVTGNARAKDFEYEPIVRMTTTYFEAGNKTFDELIQGIKKGIYIESINHGSGMSTFTIAPNRAYMIREGCLAEPIKVSVVSGSVFKALSEVEGVSNEVELLSFVTGGCGKMEQFPLPVGFGGPYVHIKQLYAQ